MNNSILNSQEFNSSCGPKLTGTPDFQMVNKVATQTGNYGTTNNPYSCGQWTSSPPWFPNNADLVTLLYLNGLQREPNYLDPNLTGWSYWYCLLSPGDCANPPGQDTQGDVVMNFIQNSTDFVNHWGVSNMVAPSQGTPFVTGAGEYPATQTVQVQLTASQGGAIGYANVYVGSGYPNTYNGSPSPTGCQIEWWSNGNMELWQMTNGVVSEVNTGQMGPGNPAINGSFCYLYPGQSTYNNGLLTLVLSYGSSMYGAQGVWAYGADAQSWPTLPWVQVGSATILAGTQYSLSTFVNPAGAGTITLSPSGGVYNSGTQVKVQANANSGYTFSNFTGNLSGSTNPQNLVMNSNMSVTANFTATQQYPTQTITTNPTGLSLKVDGIGCVSPCSYQWAPGPSHTVLATISQTLNGSQFLFSQWNDGQPASRSITAGSSGATYTATFNPRITLSGGILPSRLEVNLGSVPVDDYDGVKLNAQFPACSATWVTQACMQSFLSAYAIQGVTGVRFQFTTMRYPSTAFLGQGNVSTAWKTNLGNFFADLAAYGIVNITPTPAWDDFGTAYGDAVCAPLLNCGSTGASEPGNCGTNNTGKSLRFSPLLPYGADPNSGNPDGQNDGNAYYCSPQNPNFWGWSSHYALIGAIAGVARSITPPLPPINIEELDLQNEVDLYNFPVQARLVYDNTANPTPLAVFRYLGGALSSNGYPSTVLTVSVDTNYPGSLTAIPPPGAGTYPCTSVYGDYAEVVGSDELLAAIEGGVIGTPPYTIPNGQMLCDNSSGTCGPVGSPGWLACATNGMVYTPSQTPVPTVTDMHAKPCFTVSPTDASCEDITNPRDPNTIEAAADAFAFMWDFFLTQQLTGNLLMFGETWSNSSNPQSNCNGPAGGSFPDAALASATVTGYVQGSTYGSLYNSDRQNVVFRPWGNSNVSSAVCPTPLSIGAPSGPFIQ